jgi:hypothetical protein
MHCGDDECFVSHHVAWAKPALMVAGDEVQIDGYEVCSAKSLISRVPLVSSHNMATSAHVQ